MIKEGKLFVYKFGEDFYSGGGALTLSPREVTRKDIESGCHKRTHKDGWIIEGEIHEDYYVWVNDFKAKHPKLGKVWGNFEGKVYAEKKKGFKDFYEKHTPEAWDYWDI